MSLHRGSVLLEQKRIEGCGWRGVWCWTVMLLFLCGLFAGRTCAAEQPPGVTAAALHTNPLNLDSTVRRGFERFYNLDYDVALRIFREVAEDHAQDPIAWDYVLMGTIFRELYRQDLLDTTYYAHDSFLSSKRQVTVTPEVRSEIETLTDRVVSLADAELRTHPDDKNALFARGYGRGMHAAFITLVDHSFTAAARQGLQSRNDSEAVLKLDPLYADAKMAIGIQQFAVATLPRMVRLMVGMLGVGGCKERGLELLRDSALHGTLTAVESRTALSLFLRHDGRYAEALTVERGLASQYPHDYLFRLEVANLLKDEGHGLEAIAEYKDVLADAAKPGYFVEPRLQLAWFGLADTQRGYNDLKGAAYGYMQAAAQPNCSDWLRKRAQLKAGEVLDLLGDRGQAVRLYQLAAAAGGDQTQAETARKYLHTRYTGK